jgi:hypothetical protein
VLHARQDGEEQLDAGDLGQLDGCAGGAVGIRLGLVLVGVQDKRQRFGVWVRGGGDRPGRCVVCAFLVCVFFPSFLGGFNAFGCPVLAGEFLRQGAGEGGDVRWPGGSRFGGQQRVRRAVPQISAAAAGLNVMRSCTQVTRQRT